MGDSVDGYMRYPTVGLTAGGPTGPRRQAIFQPGRVQRDEMSAKMDDSDLTFDKIRCHLLWIIGKNSSAGECIHQHSDPASSGYSFSTGNGRKDALRRFPAIGTTPLDK
jgi:hypothetical protein